MTTAATKIKIILMEMFNMGFIGEAQYAVLRGNVNGEEGTWFSERILEIWDVIQKMPKTYENKDGIAHLHYFMPSMDWYITEKDIGDAPKESRVKQHQAFGSTHQTGSRQPELGYISLIEITQHGAELDLHFEPKVMF